jgi:hypothetical protein
VPLLTAFEANRVCGLLLCHGFVIRVRVARLALAAVRRCGHGPGGPCALKKIK